MAHISTNIIFSLSIQQTQDGSSTNVSCILHYSSIVVFELQMAAAMFPPILIILFLINSIPCAVEGIHSLHPHKNNVTDEQTLLAFKSAIKYDQNNSFITWTSNISFCKWKGVKCSVRRQRIVSLDLSSAGLEGTISPYLGNLSFLRILDLSTNNLHGPIPYQLGSLSRLEILSLDTNQLEGSIPIALSACYNLQALSLIGNHLTGNIPSLLGILPNLQFIQLARNNLTGNIPETLGNISSLNFLSLDENHLDGHVPWKLGLLQQLSGLYLEGNRLTGEIPSSLSNCTSLEALDMVDNYLHGEIPGELFFENTLLTELYLGGNRFSGRIPVTLFNCTQFQILSLENNQLNGILSIEFGKLHKLTHLSLWSNQFVSGSSTTLPFLTALTNCSLLTNILLSYNNLTGVIPSSVGQLSKNLEQLDLGSNKIRGKIPPHIGNLTNLTVLSLEDNLFTGAIPSTVGILQRLEGLYMGNNKLEGNIPMEIGQVKSLGVLALSENKLSGNIPDSLAHLQQIRYLFLDNNQLINNIPASLGECLKLEYLDLSYNKLSGHIPPKVAGLPNLVFYFNLSHNLLEGPLPEDLGNMYKVQAIDVSANGLTSHIPNAIGYCAALQSLNLSSNEFSGLIPDSFGKLQNLEDLDLSSNNLSGTIPMSFEKIKVLQHLNLSTNKLSGEVPKGGVFKKLNASSFTGNLGLCGPWVKLPPCSAPKSKSPKHFRMVFILIGTVIFVLWCVLMGFLWRCYCKRRLRTSQPFEVGPQRISFEELLAATDGFNEANLIGVGSFGKVYKGVLKNGTMVAIKVLNEDIEDSGKSFDKECNVLRRVRHRNLLRIITSYSQPGFKALIFPLMPNGSLDKFLYPVNEQTSQGQVCSLDLIQRLSIAIDIAQGIEYLHHHCFVQVIHCDLKPSNVLLGEDMTAYLTDFGISRLYLGNSMDSCTSTDTIKGSIGYIAPEYGLGGGVTTKGDVYSFGIVLLEMLTLKKPTDNIFVEAMNLQNWVSRYFPNTIVEVVDSQLLSATTNMDGSKVFNCLKQLICVGLLCTKESLEERPSMIDIARILQTIKDNFLGAASTPAIQSDLSYLLASTSRDHRNDGSESSSF